MGKESSSSSGITLTGLLLVALVVMKLAEIGAVAHWSWWAVMAPLWAPLAFYAIVLLIIAFIKSFT